MDRRSYVRFGAVALTVGIVLLSWEHILTFVLTVFGAVLPLFVGGAIAYVVNILLRFLEAHIAPHSNSQSIATLRRPLALLISLLLIVSALVLTVSLLLPAIIESVTVIRNEGIKALEALSQLPAFKPTFDAAKRALSGGIWASLGSRDLSEFVQKNAGSILGVLGDQIYGVVTSFTTVFFGVIFSVALLMDLSRVSEQLAHVLTTYLGDERYRHMMHLLHVFDSSFHNYIVRQCTEAAILGATAAVVLLVSGFPYAIGVASLVGFASLIPIVGFPIAAWAGAFLVFTERPILALVFVATLFLVQSLESNLVLPRVGDPKTVLSGAWPIVAVTIGGGIGGFLGMLVGNPIGSAIFQLIQENVQNQKQHDSTAH